MPLPPAPRKPATLIDLETIAKQRKQTSRKKDGAIDEAANAQSAQADEISPVTWQTAEALTTQAPAPAAYFRGLILPKSLRLLKP